MQSEAGLELLKSSASTIPGLKYEIIGLIKTTIIQLASQILLGHAIGRLDNPLETSAVVDENSRLSWAPWGVSWHPAQGLLHSRCPETLMEYTILYMEFMVLVAWGEV